METTTTTKKCCKCGRELPLDQFHGSARNKDGLMPFCKDCHRESARKGGRRKKTESVSPVSHVSQPIQPKQSIQEQKPTTDTSAEVKAIRALEKVYGCEEIGRWLEGEEKYFLQGYKLSDGVTAADFGAAMKDAVMNNQWMCGFPDSLLIRAFGDSYVVVAFGVNDAMTPFETHLTAAYPGMETIASETIA